MNLQTIRKQLERKKGQAQQIELDLKQATDSHESIEKEIGITEKAQAIIVAVAESTQNELQYRITEPVSLAMAAVYPEDPYKAVAEFILHGRGTTECHLGFERGGHVNTMHGIGGGVVDVSNYAYRLGSLSLMRPKPRPVLGLDEPFRFVSRDKMHLAGQMLKQTSKELGFQIIMISHIAELIEAADKVFEVSLCKGISEVKEIS